MSELHELVIVGSGPAGLTAAVYAARANLQPVVIEGLGAGGQLMLTTDVENYPGFPEGIMGPDLMLRFREQAERFGTEFVTADADRVDLSGPPFTVRRRRHASTPRRSIIISTGASAQMLGLPERGAAARSRRLHLRDLRRLLLPRAAHRRRRWRRLRDRGGAVPHEVRVEGHGRAPARRAARVEDHAGPRVREPEDRVPLELGRRRRRRRHEARRRAAARHRHRRASTSSR